MYEFMKEVASEEGLDFHYARRDFANLYHSEDEVDLSKTQLFLDPVSIETNYDVYGNKESELYTGHFMLLKHSSFQEDDYEKRYLEKIRPILTMAEEAIISEVGCRGLRITFWQSVEVINVMDENLDGLIINYQIINEL